MFSRRFSTLAANEARYNAIRKDFYNLFEGTPCMPLMVRYSWHDSGTYDKVSKTGGANASIRFDQELGHDANAGLGFARTKIEEFKAKHPNESYADLIHAGGYAAVEFAGGPVMNFRFGRADAQSNAACTPNDRLPDAGQGVDHLRDIFYRMGFNDQEIVALSGAHCLGRAHADRSGHEGAWTPKPLIFDNTYFHELLNPSSKELLRLPTDESLLSIPEFKHWVDRYAADQDKFFADYTVAHQKLTELGA